MNDEANPGTATPTAQVGTATPTAQVDTLTALDYDKTRRHGHETGLDIYSRPIFWLSGARLDLNKTAGSISEARQRGDKVFYTGRPCARGHLDIRWASNGRCRSCLNEDRGRFGDRGAQDRNARHNPKRSTPKRFNGGTPQ